VFDVSVLYIGISYVLSLVLLLGSLEFVVVAGGVVVLRAKSFVLILFLMELVGFELVGLGFILVNSRVDAERGGYVALVYHYNDVGRKIDELLVDIYVGLAWVVDIRGLQNLTNPPNLRINERHITTALRVNARIDENKTQPNQLETDQLHQK
jgi:Kynureninase